MPPANEPKAKGTAEAPPATSSPTSSAPISSPDKPAVDVGALQRELDVLRGRVKKFEEVNRGRETLLRRLAAAILTPPAEGDNGAGRLQSIRDALLKVVDGYIPSAE